MKLQNIFKSNLNEKLKVQFKSDEKKIPLKNIELFYKLREAVIELYNDYSSIISGAK